MNIPYSPLAEYEVRKLNERQGLFSSYINSVAGARAAV